MAKVSTLLLALGLLQLGCTPSAELIYVPAAEDIEKITVSRRDDVVTIHERHKVAAILATLHQANHSWQVPITTYPTPRWVIALERRNGGGRAVYWLGDHWLGTASQTTILSDAQMNVLVAQLGIQ